MPSVDPSSDGEQSCCSSSWSSSSTSSTTRDRQRMRQLKWSWAHEQRHQPINHHNREQSFSAFRRRSGSRRQSSQSRMTKEEYLRLKQMVPAVATQPRVSKVQVIEEAIKYIDSLHATLYERLRAQRVIPSGEAVAAAGTQMELQGTHQSHLVKQWIGRLLQPVMNTSSSSISPLPPVQQPRERSKSRPSFLDKVDRMVRTKKQS